MIRRPPRSTQSRSSAASDVYHHMDRDIARAAKHVIVSVEEVVDHEVIMRNPDRTVIPHFAVDAVVEVPHGAYPHELYGVYDLSLIHISEPTRRTPISYA